MKLTKILHGAECPAHQLAVAHRKWCLHFKLLPAA